MGEMRPGRVRKQYKNDESKPAGYVLLGAGNRRSLTGYIPINQRSEKGCIPAMP